MEDFLIVDRRLSVSQIIDGTLNGVLLSLMMFFTWQMYLNRRQPLNFRDFYKYI